MNEQIVQKQIELQVEIESMTFRTLVRQSTTEPLNLHGKRSHFIGLGHMDCIKQSLENIHELWLQ